MLYFENESEYLFLPKNIVNFLKKAEERETEVATEKRVRKNYMSLIVSPMRVTPIFFSVWSLLFLLFAYWQFNDPDPEIWASIYGFAAVVCTLAAFRRFYIPLLVTAAIAAFLGGLYLFPASVRDWIFQEWQQADLIMKNPDMEVARESFGLFIVSVIIGLAAYKGSVQRRSQGRRG